MFSRKFQYPPEIHFLENYRETEIFISEVEFVRPVNLRIELCSVRKRACFTLLFVFRYLDYVMSSSNIQEIYLMNTEIEDCVIEENNTHAGGSLCRMRQTTLDTFLSSESNRKIFVNDKVIPRKTKSDRMSITITRSGIQ